MSKILICEPDEHSRDFLKSTLSDHYELILTQDVSQCFHCLTSSKGIKILLLNIDASEEFSPSIIDKFKEKHPKLSVLALAGYKDTTQAEEAVRSGASGYIVRPFKPEEILAIIRNYSSK